MILTNESPRWSNISVAGQCFELQFLKYTKYLLSIMYGQISVLLYSLTGPFLHIFYAGSIEEAQYLTKAHLYIWNCGSREAGNATALTVLVLLVYIYIFFFFGGGGVSKQMWIFMLNCISAFFEFYFSTQRIFWGEGLRTSAENGSSFFVKPCFSNFDSWK